MAYQILEQNFGTENWNRIKAVILIAKWRGFLIAICTLPTQTLGCIGRLPVERLSSRNSQETASDDGRIALYSYTKHV